MPLGMAVYMHHGTFVTWVHALISVVTGLQTSQLCRPCQLKYPHSRGWTGESTGGRGQLMNDVP